MTVRAFNDRWLSTVTSNEGSGYYTDAGCPNLTLRVSARRKTFSVWIGPEGARRKMKVGEYPDMALTDARRMAQEIVKDPRAAGGGTPSENARRKLGTVQELFETVIDSMRTKGRAEGTIDDYELYLLTAKMSAVKEFGPATPARKVTDKMVTCWLAKFADRGSSPRLPRAILSATFNRGIKADNNPLTFNQTKVDFNIAFNPVTNVGGPTQSNTRDRALSLDELKVFWKALDRSGFVPQVAVLAKMLIAMGGVRVTEVCLSRQEWWIDCDDADWKLIEAGILDLPRTKNGHSHQLPMTRAAEDLLTVARRFQKTGNPYLFPSPRRAGKPRSFETLTRAVHDYCEGAGFEPFTPRDIRRTMKTLLLDMDVQQSDVDIWHNHGKNADVARRNYDRARYEQAKGRVRDAALVST